MNLCAGRAQQNRGILTDPAVMTSAIFLTIVPLSAQLGLEPTTRKIQVAGSNCLRIHIVDNLEDLFLCTDCRLRQKKLGTQNCWKFFYGTHVSLKFILDSNADHAGSAGAQSRTMQETLDE